ncbi:hypothetical protein HPHPP30_0795 [Helicobacter pylori Hp P-30]|nr:hypothetical protein HPHPP30_0795 [Helicobacter pylori Hp P-30]
MRNYVDVGSFILIAKTLKGTNLITNTPLKYFYTLYKMRWNVLCSTLSIAIFQRFLRNKTLSLPQKSQKA